MACDDCGKDFTAVPTTLLLDLRDDLHSVGWALFGLWCFLALIVWALLRKNVLTAADLLPGLAGG